MNLSEITVGTLERGFVRIPLNQKQIPIPKPKYTVWGSFLIQTELKVSDPHFKDKVLAPLAPLFLVSDHLDENTLMLRSTCMNTSGDLFEGRTPSVYSDQLPEAKYFHSSHPAFHKSICQLADKLYGIQGVRKVYLVASVRPWELIEVPKKIENDNLYLNQVY